MTANFEVVLLNEAADFIHNLDSKAREKVYYNLDKARYVRDPKLFKKLTNEIWEFRVQHRSIQYRLLAFWDKRKSSDTLVVATHGFVKKVSKVPAAELRRALSIRASYYEL